MQRESDRFKVTFTLKVSVGLFIISGGEMPGASITRNMPKYTYKPRNKPK